MENKIQTVCSKKSIQNRNLVIIPKARNELIKHLIDELEKVRKLWKISEQRANELVGELEEIRKTRAMTVASNEVLSVRVDEMSEKVDETQKSTKSISSPRTKTESARRSLSMGAVPSSLTPKFKPSKRIERQKRWTTGEVLDIMERNHSFETRVDCCASMVWSSIIKCKECFQTVHKSCQNSFKVPCIPRPKQRQASRSPIRSLKPKLDSKIQDFCTNSKPMLPYPVVLCVVAIEKKILEGTRLELYKDLENSRPALNLLQDLKNSKKTPKLETISVEVIAESLKMFLAGFRDPLVPLTSRDEMIEACFLFKSAGENNKMTKLDRTITDLPQANRETLAFLMIHWRKVVQKCKLMPNELAKFVASCVMGTKKPTKIRKEEDSKNCELAINVLLSIDDTYWNYFLNEIKHTTLPESPTIKILKL